MIDQEKNDERKRKDGWLRQKLPRPCVTRPLSLDPSSTIISINKRNPQPSDQCPDRLRSSLEIKAVQPSESREFRLTAPTSNGCGTAVWLTVDQITTFNHDIPFSFYYTHSSLQVTNISSNRSKSSLWLLPLVRCFITVVIIPSS
jgi:hypothetical protein